MSATEEDTALPQLSLLQTHFAGDTAALLAHVRAHKALAFADWRAVPVPASERTTPLSAPARPFCLSVDVVCLDFFFFFFFSFFQIGGVMEAENEAELAALNSAVDDAVRKERERERKRAIEASQLTLF